MKETITMDPAFTDQLQLMWSAETMLTESLPVLVEKATHTGLKKNLAWHLAETRQHKVAIEAICKQLGLDIEKKENPDLKKILEEGQQRIDMATGVNSIDTAIIEGSIMVEQFEIDAYEKLASSADHTIFEGVAKRLWLTYEEERQAHTKLQFLLGRT